MLFSLLQSSGDDNFLYAARLRSMLSLLLTIFRG